MRSTKLLSWSKQLLGLHAMPVPPAVFAVDERRLRYGHFGRNGDGLRLESYRTVTLDHDLFAQGPLGGPMHDPERFRSSLADLQGSLSISDAVKEASLILPDAWMRLAFVDEEEIPRRKGGKREEILRWKLQRIVPFRVEELRIRGLETTAGLQDGQKQRVLLGFGLETLLRQLEGAFADRGIHIGFVSSESLTVLAGVREVLRDIELGVVSFVSVRGYSLTFVWRGEPILHRYKALPQFSGDEPPTELVTRDLRLTELYLREQFSAASIGRVLWVGPDELKDRWLGWLSDAFELPAHSIGLEHLPLTLVGVEVPIDEAVTLLGAASQEIR